MITAQELLAGPRGRRCCLELVRLVASERPDGADLTTALFFAAAARESDGARLITASSQRPATPEETATLINEVPLDELAEPVVRTAFADAVASARPWQELDGADVLAAEPAVLAALRRVAAALVVSPHAAWWAAPVDLTGQWLVERPGRPPITGTDAADRLHRWRSGTLADEAQAVRERPADPREPISGTWWSTPPNDLPRTSRWLPAGGPTSWWLAEDEVQPETATARKVVLDREPRVLELRTATDWAEVCVRHPIDVTADRRHDWYRATGRHGRWCLPDWAEVATEFDAVHLTAAGYLSAAGKAIELPDGSACLIGGWDPDCTYWLTDVMIDNSRPLMAEGDD
ncbi:hypothetical protein [Microlunatus parietis]|uniref:Uncharacterized protein n=1 Tax=Microlunatus parietis TaxID=682979 RepID=A0A7Y9I7X5_9ACTN|nr:hypothetical protein [Microlunatus parietis]NYE71842.1 hypothetical protein [Microlunatus parietis]